MAREAIIEDADFFARLTSGMLIGLQLTADGVRDLLPAQKPAAFRFGFDNDNQKIVVVNEPFRPADKEADLAIAALEEMISQGEEVNGDLQASNASPRLENAFGRVQERLITHTNIVQAGLSNQSAARALRGAVEELSAGHFEQLRSYVEGVFPS